MRRTVGDTWPVLATESKVASTHNPLRRCSQAKTAQLDANTWLSDADKEAGIAIFAYLRTIGRATAAQCAICIL